MEEMIKERTIYRVIGISKDSVWSKEPHKYAPLGIKVMISGDCEWSGPWAKGWFDVVDKGEAVGKGFLLDKFYIHGVRLQRIK